ncbi:hypothetical protein LX16_2287 [Stackebrandtia albiflava]|uniref:Uncharacterized protein n=1 Tax=Stackebrandtia albiflava TaxID=406432 RepID=A0A562V184_9ACTN|nr:hypothetical protein [Stackebrandtia albiflava]TWJ11562.1 hypothetical protein LX16_2287 [Stackebrandtia albiflava]
MDYDITFATGTRADAVAAALVTLYQVPASQIQVSPGPPTTSYPLVTVTEYRFPDGSEFDCRMEAAEPFARHNGRRHELWLAMEMCVHLHVRAVSPGPGLDRSRWWLIEPDGAHRIVGFDPTALTERRFVLAG